MFNSLRVHVIPVGDDLIDRILAPAEFGNADKIYLITMEGRDLFAETFDKVKQQLVEKGIIKTENLEERRCNLYDFVSLMALFARIIREEKSHNNQVLFNVSTGGKLVTHAAMLACLIFEATPYYCKVDYERKIVPIPPEILFFPQYPVIKPRQDVIQFLANIEGFMEVHDRDWISKKECLSLIDRPDNEGDSTGYKKLKYRYLDKLVEWKFVKYDPQPHGRVQVTKEGSMAIQIFSEYYDIES